MHTGCMQTHIYVHIGSCNKITIRCIDPKQKKTIDNKQMCNVIH